MNKVILMGRLARDPDCDMTQSGKKKARMTIAVDRRISRANAQPGQQTADFEAYALDSGEKSDGIGIYVAFSNPEQEAEDAPYTITVNENGQTVLTLTADDGTISWVKQVAE